MSVEVIMSADEIQVNRNFKGIWIPREIWLDQKLTYFERCLLAEIQSLEGEDDGCFASNEYFMKFFNEKERKIQDGLRKLKELGYIHQKSFNGRVRELVTYQHKYVKSLFSTSGVRNSAPLGCEKTTEGGTPQHIIYNKEDNKEYTPPVSPPHSEKIESKPESAIASGEVRDISQKSKKSPPRPKESPPIKPVTPEVKEVTHKMITIIKEQSAFYRAPKDLSSFYEDVRNLIEDEHFDIAQLLTAFEWAVQDTEIRGEFKGWSGVICRNKVRKEQTSPAKQFKIHAAQIELQMKARKQRNFDPSAKPEDALKIYKEMKSRAI